MPKAPSSQPAAGHHSRGAPSFLHAYQRSRETLPHPPLPKHHLRPAFYTPFLVSPDSSTPKILSASEVLSSARSLQLNDPARLRILMQAEHLLALVALQNLPISLTVGSAAGDRPPKPPFPGCRVPAGPSHALGLFRPPLGCGAPGACFSLFCFHSGASIYNKQKKQRCSLGSLPPLRVPPAAPARNSLQPTRRSAENMKRRRGAG